MEYPEIPVEYGVRYGVTWISNRSAWPKTLALFTPSWRLHPEIYCFRNSLSAISVSFVSQKNRGRDGGGWKEERTTRKSRGIFRRTPGKEMKISNGLCLLVEPARKGSGYGGNVARKTLAYIFLRFEIARLESKFEISTVPKSTRNSE